ncbi:MAG: thiamine-phosphate kinase [Ktedonobacterales bacterium]
MRLNEVGEFALIARLTDQLGIATTRPDVKLGIGDDAAALDLGGDHLLLATCDAQVEGRHFRRTVATPEEIGAKALAVNLSDIAAMGGEPLWALVSLLTPPTLDVSVLDGVYAGLRTQAQRYGVAIVGGNVASTDGPLTIDITLLGRCPRDRLITRGGAQPGDALLVTGTLGNGLAGLLAATTTERQRLAGVDDALLREAREAMVAPTPRAACGQALAATGMITAMLDLSDGLTGDLAHICERSNVGATIDAAALPVALAAQAIATALGRDPLGLALHGGDDYELLFTTRPAGIATAIAAARASGVEAHVIGVITEREAGMRLRASDGSERSLEPQSWDHLLGQ